MRKDLLLFLIVLLFAILFSAVGHFLVGHLTDVIQTADGVTCPTDGMVPLQSSKKDFKNSSCVPSYSASARNSLPY